MRRVGIAVLVAGLGLGALTACGGSSEPTTTASDQKPAAEQTTEAATPTPTETPTPTPTETKAPDTGASGENAAYCAAAQQMGMDVMSKASKPDDSMVKSFRKVAAAAPADIKPQWNTFADTLEIVLKAQKGTSKDPAEMKKQMEELQQAAKKMQPAAQAVQKDLMTRCGGGLGN